MNLPEPVPRPLAAAHARIVLADDHRIVRDGLRALLAREPDMAVVGEADDGLQAVALARRLAPDVVVTDVAMPGLNGIDTVRRLHHECPRTRVICLSVHAEERLVLAMIEAGADGYVLKGSSYTDLATAIREVLAGRIFVIQPLVGVLVSHLRARPEGGTAAGMAAPPALTPREREVVQLLSEGYTTQEVADRLHVSAKTVATHRENIQGKLGIGGIAEMTRYALREGLSTLATPCRSASR